MAKVSRFEELICWQKTRELVNLVYEITRTEPLAKDFKLKDQLRDAAISGMSNIAEGFARFHKREFIRFLDISQSSAAEVRSLMYVVLDQKYLPPELVEKIQIKSDECRKSTLALVKCLNQTMASQSSTVKEALPFYGTNEVETWNLPEEFINRDTKTLKH